MLFPPKSLLSSWLQEQQDQKNTLKNLFIKKGILTEYYYRHKNIKKINIGSKSFMIIKIVTFHYYDTLGKLKHSLSF